MARVVTMNPDTSQARWYYEKVFEPRVDQGYLMTRFKVNFLEQGQSKMDETGFFINVGLFWNINSESEPQIAFH